MSQPLMVPVSQVRAPVLQGPQVQRTDVSSGIYAVADAARYREAAIVNDKRLDAIQRLDALKTEADQQPWDQRAKYFKDGAAKIRGEIAGSFGALDRLNPAVTGGFDADFNKLAALSQIDVNHSARAGEIDHHKATLDETLSVLARKSAEAPDPRQAAVLVEQAGKTVATAQHSGVITEEDAGNITRNFARNVERNRVTAMINDPAVGPTAALKALSDPSAFPNLKEEDILTFQSRAEAKLQHQVAMADHAAIVNERNRRLMGDQIAKEGFDLLAKGKLTDEWMDNNRRVLDTSDYKMLRQGMSEGGGMESAQALADLYQRVYIDGVDAAPIIINDMRAGAINPQTAKALLDENKAATPVKRAKSFITQYLKPSDINPSVAQAQQLAEAISEFDRFYAQDTKQDPMELARKVVQRNAATELDKMTLIMPLPQYAIGGSNANSGGIRTSLDIKATKEATNKAFLAKHNGDQAAVNRDPDFLREARVIKSWEDSTARLAPAAQLKQGAK